MVDDDGGAGRRLKKTFRLLALALLLGFQAFAQNDAALFPPKPEPAVFVHDYAGWLRPEEKMLLEQKLARYSDTTSTQIVVMIRPDIGDYDKASYAFELGNRWGIGRKQKNNGVVVLIKTEAPERGAFIATGYGTEGALPDILAGQIVRNVMIPSFKQNQYFKGIDAGLTAIIGALSGEFSADKDLKPVNIPIWGFLLVLGVFVLFVAFFAWKLRRSTVYTGRRIVHRHHDTRSGSGGFWWLGGPWIGGGNSGGNNWGGGGSSGWGGGDSFGGGSFGGGGAGGDW